MKTICFIVTMLIVCPIVSARADAPTCGKVEAMSFCPPDLVPPSGGNYCGPCTYCAGGGSSYKQAVHDQDCHTCVCGVDCPASPSGEGCQEVTYCKPVGCHEEDVSCSNDTVTLPSEHTDSGCKCPDAPAGYGECSGQRCGSDQSC